MRELALEHVGEDLHVPMRVTREASEWGNPVVVDDPQGAEAHVRRIVVVREGKREMAVQPTVVHMATFLAATDSQCGADLHA